MWLRINLINFLRAVTAPVTKDLLSSAIIVSKKGLVANLRTVEDRPFGPTADSVLEDQRSLKISSAGKRSTFKKTGIV